MILMFPGKQFLINGYLKMMSNEVPQYFEPELVEVRADDDGAPSFYLSTREGWENIGPEIQLAANLYNIGTKITLEERIVPD